MSSRWSRQLPSWHAGLGLMFLATGLCSAGPSAKSGKDAKPRHPTSTSTKTEDDKKTVPQVEVYIPSVARLAEEVQRSRTAKLFQAMAAMLPDARGRDGRGLRSTGAHQDSEEDHGLARHVRLHLHIYAGSRGPPAVDDPARLGRSRASAAASRRSSTTMGRKSCLRMSP